MVIMAVRVAGGMEVQKLMGQMNSARGKDDGFLCLCHRAEVLEEVREIQQKKTGSGSKLLEVQSKLGLMKLDRLKPFS